MSLGQSAETMDVSPALLQQMLQSARDLDKSGAWLDASAAFEALAVRLPSEAEVHLAYGRALAARRLQAETQLRRALELAPDRADIKIELGTWLLEIGRLDEASSVLEPMLELDPGNLRVIDALADLAERRNQLDRAFSLYLQGVRAAPGQAKAYPNFLKFLRRVEADHAQRAAETGPESAKSALFLARSLRRAGQAEEAQAALGRAAALEPDSKAGRTAAAILGSRETEGPVAATKAAKADKSLTDLAQAIARKSASRPSVWPTKTHLFEDFESVVRRYVLAGYQRQAGLISRTTKIANMGSCFAEHLADRLIMRGIDVFHRRVAENINSTCANRYLLDWVVDGVHDDRSEQMEAFFGATERAAYREHLSAAEIFIFSLGAAPCFFEAETGEFVLPYQRSLTRHVETVFRTTTLEENVFNLNRIVQRLRSLSPKVQVVLTVSPVALEGSQEMRSAVIADCVSKSTLRLAAHEILRQELEGVHYWPSFEIARWLSGHLPPGHEPAFGWGGSTRHVSLWLQDLIIGLFLEYFGDETLVAVAPAGQTA